jgi:hypothetical protein
LAEMINGIKISLVEERALDAWIDFSLRQVREGLVRFYRARDFLTGDWLFKTCIDNEFRKLVVKAVKCPPGRLFAQFEGDTMVFQKSAQENLLYDVISTSYIDEKGRVRRKMTTCVEEVPQLITERFQIMKHGEATNRQTPVQDKLVTLTSEDDHKSPILLFLLQRVWPLSPRKPEEAYTAYNISEEARHTKKTQNLGKKSLLSIIKRSEKAKLEDIYLESSANLGMSQEETESAITELEKERLILRFEPDYLKTRR